MFEHITAHQRCPASAFRLRCALDMEAAMSFVRTFGRLERTRRPPHTERDASFGNDGAPLEHSLVMTERAPDIDAAVAAMPPAAVVPAISAQRTRWLARASEPDLIAAAQAETGDAAAALLTRYRPMLEVVGIGIARDLGEDALQNLAMRFVSKLAKYDAQRGTFGAWLRRVATNEALMVLRSEKRHLRVVVDAPTAGSDTAASRLIHKMALAEFMEALDPTDQQIIVGRFVEGLTARQIAQDLFMAEATVRTRVHRIRRRARSIARRHGLA